MASLRTQTRVVRARCLFFCGFSEDFLILADYSLLDHGSGFLIDRMGDIFMGAVLSLLAGHRDKIPASARDDLDVSDHEAVIECDRHVSFELLLIDRKDSNIRELHRDLPFVICQLEFRGWLSFPCEI